jgi:hypothetical protein
MHGVHVVDLQLVSGFSDWKFSFVPKLPYVSPYYYSRVNHLICVQELDLSRSLLIERRYYHAVSSQRSVSEHVSD